MTDISWIAVDWGTTRLRAWAMGPGDMPVAEACSDAGMGGLARTEFQPALLALVEPWLHDRATPVLACGMVGSRQGWHEVGYASVPAEPRLLRPVCVPNTDTRMNVAILPGLSQTDPPDVMRGEETQISGFLAEHPDFDGVLCLPGTHTKWVRISAREVVSFQTAMTGELFALISNQSVVRHALVGGGTEDDQEFSEAVADMLSQPERLTQRLFSIRAQSVVGGLAPGAAVSRLSGLLIGAELAATRAYWLGQDVAIAAEPGLAARYALALAGQGVTAKVHDAAPLTLRGLSAAYSAMPETVK